jgi:hypothetical protein
MRIPKKKESLENIFIASSHYNVLKVELQKVLEVILVFWRSILRFFVRIHRENDNLKIFLNLSELFLAFYLAVHAYPSIHDDISHKLVEAILFLLIKHTKKCLFECLFMSLLKTIAAATRP